MGWIAVSPQGVKDKFGITGWNAGIRHVAYGFHFDLLKNIDDVGFINAIIDEMSNRHNIDSKRIFVLGFSMGGFMANRLAIECGSRFRAVCSVNGTIGNLIQNMQPKNPVNILHIHGTNDMSVPYNPAPHTHPPGLGAEQTFEFWRKYNGNIGEPEIWHYPKLVDDGISFERYSYTNGTHSAMTEMIKVVNGSHTWYDNLLHDIDYSVEITRFFETVPLLTK
jgi:polyhydroxybutyrate depolymerase